MTPLTNCDKQFNGYQKDETKHLLMKLQCSFPAIFIVSSPLPVNLMELNKRGSLHVRLNC